MDAFQCTARTTSGSPSEILALVRLNVTEIADRAMVVVRVRAGVGPLVTATSVIERAAVMVDKPIGRVVLVFGAGDHVGLVEAGCGGDPGWRGRLHRLSW